MVITKDLKNSRDVKNGSEYIGKKNGIQSAMILKKHGFFKDQNNFLTLKLSTVVLSSSS